MTSCMGILSEGVGPVQYVTLGRATGSDGAHYGVSAARSPPRECPPRRSGATSEEQRR